MKIKFDMAQYLNKASQPKQEQQTSQIQKVSVYDLEPNPHNFYGVRDIESLAVMIELQGGIVTPLEVKDLKNGKYIIIAGHRRRAAILYLLEQESEKITSPLVPVIVRSYENDESEMMALIFSNRGQRKRTVDEITEEINRLQPIARRIYKQEKEKGNVSGRFRKFFAEEILQISEASLQRRTQLGNLSNEVREEIDKGTMTLTSASELANLKPDEQNKILNHAKENSSPITVKSIQKEKENIKKTKEPKNLENNKTIKNRQNEKSIFPQIKQIHDKLLSYKEKIVAEFTKIELEINNNPDNIADLINDLYELGVLLEKISDEMSKIKG